MKDYNNNLFFGCCWVTTCIYTLFHEPNSHIHVIHFIYFITETNDMFLLLWGKCCIALGHVLEPGKLQTAVEEVISLIPFAYCLPGKEGIASRVNPVNSHAFSYETPAAG